MEIRPGSYLFNHLEPQDETQQIEQFEHETENLLDEPIIEGLSLNYSTQRKIERISGDSAIALSFTDLPYEESRRQIGLLQQAKQKATTEKEREKIDKMIRFYATPTYTINTFNLRKGEHELDLDQLKLAFPGTRIIFNPQKEMDVYCSSESGEILVSGDVTKLETILNTLHEIGHTANPNNESLAARSRFTKRESVTEQEAELILENERKAWAFALQRIKPFLDQNQRNEVIQYIHESSLKSYSNGIRAQIAPRWKLILPHLIELLDNI